MRAEGKPVDRRTFLLGLGALGAATLLDGNQPRNPTLERVINPQDMDHKIFGIAHGSWWWANENMPAFEAHLRSMADADCNTKGYVNFVQIHFSYELPNIRRPEIIPLGDRIPDLPNHAKRMDQNIARTIDLAHALGLGVLLKPHLEPRSDGSLVDRARIDYGQDERTWETFFSNYTRIMRRYSRLAREQHVEMFAYACELQGTIGRVQNWKRVINAIRDEGFSGSLMYTGLKTRQWLGEPYLFDDDAHRIIELSDFVCPHFYGPLGSREDWSVSRLRDDFADVLSMYERIAAQHHKTILMTETGVRPVRAHSANPWDYHHEWTHPDNPLYDERMQSHWVDAIVRDSLASSMVKGVFWWDAVSDYQLRELGEKHLHRAYQQMICE